MTREILREPAEPAAFDWRLSLATIDSPGPFSAFDGYHRHARARYGRRRRVEFCTNTAPSRLSTAGTDCVLRRCVADELHPFGRLQYGPEPESCRPERAQSASRSAPLTEAQVIQTAGWSEVFVCLPVGDDASDQHCGR